MNANSCLGCDTCAATYARVDNGQTCQACAKAGCNAYTSNTCDCTTCAAQYELDGTSCKAVSEGAPGAGCAAARRRRRAQRWPLPPTLPPCSAPTCPTALWMA